MRRLLSASLLALLVAACASGKPPAPTPGAVVTLATFTGVVDTEAGTFEIRLDPPGAASPVPGGLVTIASGASTLSIANSGAPWNNTPSPTVACGGQKVTGAQVIVTSNYPSQFAGGLYAQIDTFSGTGVQACNGTSPVPPGLDGTKGLWAYGTLTASSYGSGSHSATVEWNFLTGSTTRFTFQGSLKAVVGDLFAYGASPSPPAPFGLLTTAWPKGQPMAYNPQTQGMVYTTSANKIAFVNLDGTLLKETAVLDGGGGNILYISDLSIDPRPTGGRIWFVARPQNDSTQFIGVMDGDGNNMLLSNQGSIGVTRFVYDPWVAAGTRAWRNSAAGGVCARTNALGAEGSCQLTNAYNIVFGANSWALYVWNGSLITRCDTAGGTDFTGRCTSLTNVSSTFPEQMVQGSGITAYNEMAWTDWSTRNVESLDNFGVNLLPYFLGPNPLTPATRRPASLAPDLGAVARAQANTYWYLSADTGTGKTYVSTAPTTTWSSPSTEFTAALIGSSSDARVVAASPAVTVNGTSYPAYLWVIGSAGLYRIQTN